MNKLNRNAYKKFKNRIRHIQWSPLIPDHEVFSLYHFKKMSPSRIEFKLQTWILFVPWVLLVFSIISIASTPSLQVALNSPDIYIMTGFVTLWSGLGALFFFILIYTRSVFVLDIKEQKFMYGRKFPFFGKPLKLDLNKTNAPGNIST